MSMRGGPNAVAKVEPAIAVLGFTLVCTMLLSACSLGGGRSADRATTEQSTQPTSESAAESAPTLAPDALAAVDAAAGRARVSEGPPEDEPELAPYGPGVGHLDLAWLADQAALVVIDTQTEPGSGGALDLGSLPNLADRVALGLAELGLAFTRTVDADPDGHHGTAITVHDDTTAVLDRWRFRTTTNAPGAVDVRNQTRLALERRIDVEIVPEIVDAGDGEAWSIAATADPSRRAGELVGEPSSVIAWSNREAQRYVAEAVSFEAGELSISTSSRQTPPSVTELPYDSGMVVSQDVFGWATFSADVSLPEGGGLWPAIWLLDAEACEAPGRCSGYESPDFHEIDLLEVRGQQPGDAHLSVHWWDERIRSSSEIAPIGGSPFRLDVERRPGLLVWRIDGEVVRVVTDRVDTFERGLHRGGSMRLIVNTAVGGSFAGEREVGRDGAWLGDALVPDSYPAELRATFRLSDLRISSMG